jgi:glycosyltransferase involved in cell wall biosynthesis
VAGGSEAHVSDPRLVSVVTCFLDAERFFEEAIESVFAQTHPAWELLLVDDGSSDRSPEIARRYARRHPDRVRCLAHPDGRNHGKSASRNIGIAAARGPLVAFLDADDVLLPNALRTLAGAISRSPEAAVAYGRTRLWFSWPGNPDGRDAAWDFDSELPAPEGTVLAPGALLPALAREDDVLPSVCSAIVRRAAIERVGGWEPAFPDLYDDFVLWAKLMAEAPVLVIDETLSRYRKHPDSSCELAERSGAWSPVDLSVSRYHYLAWLERYLTRRRLGDEATWKAIEDGLAPYRDPTAPALVERVVLHPGAREGVAPAVHGHLDHPRPAGRTRSHRVPVDGWVAGAGRRAVGIDLVADGRTLRHVPLDGRRPDVAATLGAVGIDGEGHGFGTSVALAGTAPLEVEVAAVLADKARVPLARLAARRVLRGEDRRLGSPPVSVVIVCRAEQAALAGTIESALAQDHRPLEVVVVDDGSASALERIALAYPGVRYVRTDGVGVAAARRAGLRRATGEHVLFLAAGERLHRTAVAAALRRIAHRPECGFVAGTGADRPLDAAMLRHEGAARGVALYRRFALAAVGGIPDAPPGREDLALRLRVAERFPGIAIADPLLVAPPAAVVRSEDAGRARRRPRRLRRREGRALILLYHRIAELPADPWALGVAPARFAEQLAVLRAQARPLPLGELVDRIRRGRRLPPRSVAVTFDDGYRDNLEAGLPALAAARVPAMLFLAAGCVGRTRELWWDELERVLLAPGELPAQLRLRIGARTYERDLGEAARYREAAARCHAGWQVGQPPPTARHAAYAELWAALRPLAEARRDAALDELLAWAGAADAPRASHRMLEAEDVAALASGGAVEIGAHTISHPRLATQRRARQEDEIVRGKRLVEELSGRPARHFAYPFGGLDDYGGATAALVAEAGFAGACATWEGTAHRACDPFQLPRVQVPDLDGAAFEAWLAACFER